MNALGVAPLSKRLTGLHAPVLDAMVQLDDESSEDAAALELRQRVASGSSLRLARANVAKIRAESSGWVIERAAAIVESAMRQGKPADSEIDHVASCGWVYDGLCPHCHPGL